MFVEHHCSRIIIFGKTFIPRFYSDGVKGGILFGLLNYDIMIIYEKLIERFSNLKRMT